MADLSFVIFMYCLYLSADGRTFPLSAIVKPFQLCSRTCNSPKDSSDSFIPPYQCSCSPSCVVFGDCCYDSPYKDTKSPLQFEFICFHVEGKGKFQAVLSCPPHIRSSSCREQFGRMPPVTSRITNITYGNAFCATCNEDDEDLVKWNVQLRCSSDDDWLDFTRKVNYKHDLRPGEELDRNWTSCRFQTYDEDSRFLIGLELRPCDLLDMVNRCSKAWNEQNSDKKCRSYIDPVYVGDTLFRNFHCAECNYMDLSDADCIPRRMKDMLEQGIVDENYIRACMTKPPHSCLYKTGIHRMFSLEIYFNPDFFKGKENEDMCTLPEGEKCPDGEQFDDLTCDCRRIKKG